MTQEEKSRMIQALAADVAHLENLIAIYGENRSLGNVLQNLKSRLDWWENHQ